MENFTPKGEQALREEIIAEFGFNEDEHDAIIDGLVARELKGEAMKASLHKQKMTAKAELEALKKPVEKKDDSKEENKNEDKKSLTEEEIDLRVDKKMFKANGGDSEQLRQIEKIMKATGKSFEQAQSDSLYKGWNDIYLSKKETEETSRGSQLPPARGGSTVVKQKADEQEQKFVDSLPDEFKPVKK